MNGVKENTIINMIINTITCLCKILNNLIKVNDYYYHPTTIINASYVHSNMPLNIPLMYTRKKVIVVVVDVNDIISKMLTLS